VIFAGHGYELLNRAAVRRSQYDESARGSGLWSGKNWERSVGCPSGQQRKQSQRTQRGTPAGDCRAEGRAGRAMKGDLEHGCIQANYPQAAKPYGGYVAGDWMDTSACELIG
jgi:hypothetical protein